MNYKPLDIIKTNENHIGMITSVSLTQGHYSYAIVFFDTSLKLKHAWWDATEFMVINNLAAVIGKEMTNCDTEGEIYCDYVYKNTSNVICCANCTSMKDNACVEKKVFDNNRSYKCSYFNLKQLEK